MSVQVCIVVRSWAAKGYNAFLSKQLAIKWICFSRVRSGRSGSYRGGALQLSTLAACLPKSISNLEKAAQDVGDGSLILGSLSRVLGLLLAAGI